MAQALRAGLRNGGIRRGGLRPGLGNGSLFAIAPLDMFFARTRTLDSRVTFTRASSGTYVGSDGVLRTATTNYLLQSNTFNTTWGGSNVALTSGSTTSPSGVLDGWLISDNATSASHNITQSISWTVGATTFSVYAKYNNHRWLGIRIGATGNVFFGSWDLQNGVVGSSTAGATIGMQSVGNGWYRLVLTATLTTASTSNLLIGLNNADATSLTSYSGTGSGIYLWGAQLEQSSTVGEYIPTTSTINSAPRFDHNPTTGESLGLLVEEQRTNLLQRSEEFDNAYWTKGGSTISANSATAPDGLTTADKLVEDTSTGNHRLFVATTSLAANTAHSLSVYVKAAGRTFIRVEVRDSVGAFAAQDFNLTTLAITTAGSGTGSISLLGNGWYRCTVTGTSSASGGLGTALFWALSAPSGTSYTGDGTSGLLLWGAQLEAGAFPTSYIPTTTAAATRSADVASITGTNFSSWYRQDEGTVFVSVRLASLVNTYEASFTDNSNNNHHFLRYLAGQHQVFTKVGGIDGASIFSDGGGGIAASRNAYGYRANSFAISTNGLAGISSTSTANSVPAVDRLNIGMSQLAAATGNLHVTRLTYWPARLPNSTLQTLTQ